MELSQQFIHCFKLTSWPFLDYYDLNISIIYPLLLANFSQPFIHYFQTSTAFSLLAMSAIYL